MPNVGLNISQTFGQFHQHNMTLVMSYCVHGVCVFFVHGWLTCAESLSTNATSELRNAFCIAHLFSVSKVSEPCALRCCGDVFIHLYVI